MEESKGGEAAEGKEGGYAGLQVHVNSEQVSLQRKLVNDSATLRLLTSAGSSFHHCGSKKENSCVFLVQPLLIQ